MSIQKIGTPMPRAERGRLGSRSRWDADAVAKGKPPGLRVVRLDELDPTTAGIIRAIIAAREHAAAGSETG